MRFPGCINAFFSSSSALCVCAITTDAARRKQPLLAGKGAKNTRESLVGCSRSGLSSQLTLGDGECLLWELGELHVLVLLWWVTRANLLFVP